MNFAASKIINKDISAYMHTVGERSRAAASVVANISTEDKNRALNAIADAIDVNAGMILAANLMDVKNGQARSLNSALLDRLELNPDRVEAMAAGCRQVAGLEDPVGQMTEFSERPSGIKVGKMRVPLGVIGIIYESRPNVTIDAAVLCLKSGNAAILRGGSEAIKSNMAIADCIRQGLTGAALSTDCIQVVETTDRDAVGALITDTDHVDIIIPRGGKSLIERISVDASVPVIKHLDGICHVYVDEHANYEKAVRVAYNAKARRYGICGAMETLLVAASRASEILPPLLQQYRDKGIELRGCALTRQISPELVAATEEDWRTEYLGAVLSIKVVSGLDEAISHINCFGSHHTDAIITEDNNASDRFLREVDSSSVMLNASTQFADGFEYGLGAEIGISTDKLHVRGPVGLEGLTSQKYIVVGNGTARV
jgi:glutamate-5-semialdehyde dehydrogenase|uniref:Gamma-glutamyl phosphate reductase n=1 Tax=uncultured bacterium B19D1_C12D4_E9D6 TaxID=1329637 RepID=S4W414_9BACT|nr:gamma-glutamyl phosphate reductase [uncultured bacterium B19D1_C12D4_E9D6]